MRVQRLPYLVAVPIPTRDRAHRRIPKVRCGMATKTVMKAFGEWFGGATAMPWPCLGTWTMVDGSGVVVEKGQTVVVVMTTRKDYRAHRGAIEHLVEDVAKMLDQEAMAVIVSKASDGYLLFPSET
jgi:hypothetical protein